MGLLHYAVFRVLDCIASSATAETLMRHEAAAACKLCITAQPHTLRL
jgi:hypothetical protein